jgi:spore maturation protein CgeB
LEHADPAFLFVESAYEGVARAWSTRIARFGSPHSALASVVDWFRTKGRPTVFWNKEDPINYDWFVASASLFDHVFTVDSNAIDRYRRDLGHDRIWALPFAAQPVLNHPPADESERTGRVAFAGSYYAAKHPERRRQMEYVLDPAREFDLHIFDRMGTMTDDRFAWPERFRPHIVGSLSYAQTLEAYRRYRVFLNVNTVVDSPTMCARRIFELVASGTKVVSGPSRAIDQMIPPGVVSVVHDADETKAALTSALEGRRDEEAVARGLDWIRAGHTYSHRVDAILERIF